MVLNEKRVPLKEVFGECCSNFGITLLDLNFLGITLCIPESCSGASYGAFNLLLPSTFGLS